MLITRTETYTDWVFQSAHANEIAAPIGHGLLHGHIYFRYAYNMLREGDTVKRETSHVHLSDGSTYELGDGTSSEKIEIVFNGTTSDGSVSLTVSGKTGVGVNRITRNLTIEYDDGKVPVLDTEQLDGMLGSLTESLTESMQNTANAVKEELREELKTTTIELKDDVAASLSNHTVEVERLINTEVQEVETKVDGLSAQLPTLKQELNDKIDSKIKIGAWTTGQYSVSPQGFNNVLNGVPTYTGNGDPEFIYNEANKSLVLGSGVSTVNRILRLTYTSYMEVPDGHNGFLSFIIRNLNGGVQVRNTQALLRRDNFAGQVNAYQFSVDLFLPAGVNHPIYTEGFRPEFENQGNTTVVLKSGALLSMMLFTAG